MGEVFRASDTRLNRTVAIKILPPDKVADPERRRRFLQEARAASALNHPNIVVLHDIAADQGVDYLVMEYVSGQTLDKLISSKGMPVKEAAGYAAQIAGALAAAHAAGVIHRDIKPSNVIVTAESQVKVLDFGLAKLMERSSGSEDETETQDTALTETGGIVGTVAYMSPEQATARPLDQRTDIFSLGVVLHEMVSGRRLFQGDSQIDTLHAILHDAAPPVPPSDLNEILEKALAKDPKERYSHAADMALDLRRLGRSAAFATQATPRAGTRSLAPWVVVAVLALAVPVAWFVRGSTSSADNPLADAKFTRLTDYSGSELDAAISPDGKFVAFLSDRDGPFDLFVGQVGAGQFENRTHGKEGELLEPTRSIGFSGDGSEIWLRGGTPEQLNRPRANPPRLMPLMGGPPRPFLNDGVMVAWSAEGNRIAYHSASRDPIFVADRNGANPNQIFIDPNPDWHNHFLVWSQDGRWIYFVRGNPAVWEMDIWRISPSGGKPERITYHNTNVAYPAPIDAHTLLYVAPDEDGSGPWLWAVDTERKVSRKVSFGLEQYRSVQASADGRRIVATVANPIASLWSVPITDHTVDEQGAHTYPLPTVRALAPRFGGESLFYLSSLGGGDGLWRYRLGQTLEIWRGSEGALLEPVGVTLDGSRVAFLRRKRGRIQVHVMGADGTGLVALADGIDARNSPAWSPDGKWIAVGGSDAKGAGLFKIPVDGGAPVRLADKPGFDPVWSADGNLIVYGGPVVGRVRTLHAVHPDGKPVEFPEIHSYMDTGQGYRFLPDGKGLVYTNGVLRRLDFWLLDLSTMKSRQLTRLNNSAVIRAFDITPDGRQIVFDRVRENSDIVLIEVPGKKKGGG